MFDYIQKITSTQTVECTKDLMQTVMRSTLVGDTCAEIADLREKTLRGEMSREDFDTKKSELKRRLPAFCFHAHFTHGRRQNDDAVGSGLSILDIDHLPSPEAFYSERVKGRESGLGIFLVHLTPSGEGLRLVFALPCGMGLVEGQRWMAGELGLAEFDDCCKDWARCSFAVPENYVLFADWEGLFKDYSKNQKDDRHIDTVAAAPVAAEAGKEAAVAGAGVKAANIGVKPLIVFDLCREQAGLKDVDINTHGSRHSSLLAILSVGAARLLSEDEAMGVVAERMPEFYSERDCRQLIHDFYAKYHDSSKIMSPVVQRINARAELLAARAKAKHEEEGDSDEVEHAAGSFSAAFSIPPIPGIKQSLAGVPQGLQMPVVCALMPLAAAYADGASFRYCDGRVQQLGLMSIIVGEQASGKSVCKDVVDLWRKPMDDADSEARKVEDEWKKKRKNRRANERLDPEPEVLIRDVPITISCSTLLKRLKNARGHTLFSFSSELDTLRKTNGAGSWSSKYDIYRLSFDHDVWGQDYNSDQAESGMVSVGYNWTILGTYGALRKCFRGDNIENGLSSRVMLAEMPDSTFAPMPRFHESKERDVAAILEAVSTLQSKQGLYETPRLARAIYDWVERKRQEAMANADLVADTYRRRAAVIGMRCGVVAYLLSGEKETKNVIAFALTMAEYVMQEQCRLFGDVLRKQYAADNDVKRESKNLDVFNRIGAVFSFHDIINIRNDITNSSARAIISRWHDAGWIEALPREKGNNYRKYKKITNNPLHRCTAAPPQ